MPSQISQRVQRVVGNLLPSTGLDGKFGSPRNLQERMEYYHTPGVSIAIINDFEIEWVQGFGTRDARFDRQVTEETLFQAGSISKFVFALAVLRLVQEGKLSLDKDVNSYLSSWKVPANAGWQPKVTLRQLLSHTAGLTVHGFPGYQISEHLPPVPQILSGEPPANTARVEVNILPGTQFRYSGGGTTVAQQVLVDVLGKPFPQIMDELVIGPLGLANSTYRQPLSARRARGAATAHSFKSIPVKGRFHSYPEMAAAGLWTTATDLAKMGVELLQVLHAKKQSSLLTKEVIESMLVPQLNHQKVGEGEFVGLGFFCNGRGNNFHFGHSGMNKGFIADMRFYQEAGKGAVVMINSGEGSPLVAEIMRAVAREYDWPDFFLPEKKPMELVGFLKYTGFYTNKAGLEFHVIGSGNSLFLEHEGQEPLPIQPLSDIEFFTPSLNLAVRFEMDEEGNITALIIDQKGYRIKADRASNL